MKTVLLMRHAKSSWDNPAMDDHERPLNKRGLSAAPMMGQLLKQSLLAPQIIVSSTAERARTTAEIIASECGFEDGIIFTDDLYLAPPSTYLSIISQLNDAHDRVLLVGHNPGISELATSLCNEPVSMPTAAIACTQTRHKTWRQYEVDPASELAGYWRPKHLD